MNDMVLDFMGQIGATIVVVGTLGISYRSLTQRVDRLGEENRADHHANATKLDAVRDDVAEIRSWQAVHEESHRRDRWTP